MAKYSTYKCSYDIIAIALEKLYKTNSLTFTNRLLEVGLPVHVIVSLSHVARQYM